MRSNGTGHATARNAERGLLWKTAFERFDTGLLGEPRQIEPRLAPSLSVSAPTPTSSTRISGPKIEGATLGARKTRSEEHTSELQSLMRISYAVFCLNKKNKNTKDNKCRIS